MLLGYFGILLGYFWDTIVSEVMAIQRDWVFKKWGGGCKGRNMSNFKKSERLKLNPKNLKKSQNPHITKIWKISPKMFKKVKKINEGIS